MGQKTAGLRRRRLSRGDERKRRRKLSLSPEPARTYVFGEVELGLGVSVGLTLHGDVVALLDGIRVEEGKGGFLRGVYVHKKRRATGGHVNRRVGKGFPEGRFTFLVPHHSPRAEHQGDVTRLTLLIRLYSSEVISRDPEAHCEA